MSVRTGRTSARTWTWDRAGVAVDIADQRRDMYYPTCSEHDERLELEGWTYYVRAVKWRDQFTTSPAPRSGSAIFDSLVHVGREIVFGRRRPWIVGVVRLGSISTWNDLTPRVVHSEVLAPGNDPRSRISELLDDARQGRFRPV